MSEKRKKLIAKRKKTTTIVQVVYVEWKLFGSHRDDPSQKVPPDNTAPCSLLPRPRRH